MARLLLEPGVPVSKDVLVEGLWRDNPPPSARRTVDSILSRWRRRLGPEAIETVQPGIVRLAVEDQEVDAVRFRELVLQAPQLVDADTAAAEAGLSEALASWRGNPFPELVDWPDAQPVISELVENHSRAEELRLDARLRSGLHAAVVGEAERLVATEPSREARWAQLITALAGAGRQADALRAFARCRAALIEQSGIEPSPTLAALERRVLEADPTLVSSTAAAPLPAPVDVDRHFGRSQELATISATLGEARTLTLTGPGGIGKTRLARLAARQLGGPATNEVFVVELAPLPAGADAAVAVAESIGVKRQTGQSATDAIVDSLRHQTSLLVLDNAEHVIESTRALVSALTAAAADLKIIVTSREILLIPGERVLTVPALGSQNEDHDAVALFIERAREAGTPISHETNRGPIAEICAAVAYIPLAIELAAAQTRSSTPEEILHQLRTHPDTLNADRSRTGRHDGIDRCIAWSFALLDDTERRALSRLSVFRGGFDRAAADHLLEQPSHKILNKLVSQSLLTADTTQPTTRYRILEPIRQQAEKQCEEQRHIETRHAEYFAGLASTIDRWLLSEKPRQATETFALELANFRATHANTLRSGQIQLAIDFVSDLGWIAREQIAFEVLSWAEATLEAAACSDERFVTEEVKTAVISFNFLQGNLAAVEQDTTTILASSEASPRARYRAAFDYAWALLTTGRGKHAEPYARTVLAESETIGNGVLRSGALTTLAVALSLHNTKTTQAEMRATANEAISVADRSGDYARATSRVFATVCVPQRDRVGMVRAAVEYAQHAGLTQFTSAAKRTLAEELLVANQPADEPAQLLIECLDTWSRLRMRIHWMFTLEVAAQCLALHDHQDTAQLIWAHQLRTGVVPSVSYRRAMLNIGPPADLDVPDGIGLDELTSAAQDALGSLIDR